MRADPVPSPETTGTGDNDPETCAHAWRPTGVTWLHAVHTCDACGCYRNVPVTPAAADAPRGAGMAPSSPDQAGVKGEDAAPSPPPGTRTDAERDALAMVGRLAAMLKRAEAQVTEHHASHHVRAFAEPGTVKCPACAAMAERHSESPDWAFFEDVREALTAAKSLAERAP